MTEETLAIRLPWWLRLRQFLSHPASWREVARFLGVGAVGYAVNLAVYAAGVHAGGLSYRAAAVAAFACALSTTFVLNRHFTFAAHDGHLPRQAWRYLLVNLGGFATNLAVLGLLVERAAVAKVAAEAIAAVMAAPVNFAGQRLWAFARPRAADPGGWPRLDARRAVWPGVVVALTVLAAVVRASTALAAQLWIDEGISIGIARHPLAAIPGLLRHDGSPPVYYVLLHWWIGVFGASPSSNHALSVVFAVLAVPACAWAVWRPFGPRAGAIAAALAAFSPFAGQYADEARMYTLAFLLAALATGAFLRAFVLRSRPWAIAFGALTALLSLTHGWGLFYAAGAACALAVLLAFGPDRRRLAVDALLAGAVGAVLFAPWVPTLLFQAAHTGAPWSHVPHLRSLERAGSAMFAGRTPEALLLVVAGGGLLTAIRGRSRTAVPLVCVAAIALVALGAGFVASHVSQPVWALRYLAIPLAPLLIAVAAGVDRAGAVGLVALVFVCATAWAGKPSGESLSHKSDVRELAATLGSELAPGTLVASPQPEQVPVLHYYLGGGFTFVTPLGVPRDLGAVDWADAFERLRASRVRLTLGAAVRRVPPGGRILLAAPRFGRATSPWTKTIKREARRWRRWLESRPGLVEVDRYEPARYGSRATLGGYLFERRGRPFRCATGCARHAAAVDRRGGGAP